MITPEKVAAGLGNMVAEMQIFLAAHLVDNKLGP